MLHLNPDSHFSTKSANQGQVCGTRFKRDREVGVVLGVGGWGVSRSLGLGPFERVFGEFWVVDWAFWQCEVLDRALDPKL